MSNTTRQGFNSTQSQLLELLQHLSPDSVRLHLEHLQQILLSDAAAPSAPASKAEAPMEQSTPTRSPIDAVSWEHSGRVEIRLNRCGTLVLEFLPDAKTER